MVLVSIFIKIKLFMKFQMIKVAILISFLILSNNLYSKNYHTQPLGSDSNDGSSFSKAFKTIQKATNLAEAGDSILVYDGLYKGFDHFYKNSGTAQRPIVYFANGKNVIINQSCGRGFDGLNVEGSDYIEINGFKVKNIADANGSGEDGIRAVIANHVIIRNCEVDSCYRGIFTGYTDDFLAENNICKRSYGEHGIYVSNNSDRVVIRYNFCFENKAAGIQLNPDLSSGSPGISYDVKIYNNVCYKNRIGLNLQGIYYSEVYNNLIYSNGSGNGGNGMTFFLGDAATGCHDVKVYHNTVVVPSGSQWAILAIDSDSLQIYNNILISFSPKGCLDIESSCTNIFSDYNILNDKITTDQGNSYINFKQWQNKGYDLHSILVSDNASLFKDLSNNDYHLTSLSVARNSGLDFINFITTDLDKEKRPQGKGYDIGCYEFKETTENVDKKNIASDIHWVNQNGYLLVEDLEEDQSLFLVSVFGLMVGRGNKLDLTSLETGLYIAHVVNHKGIIIASKKIIIL